MSLTPNGKFFFKRLNQWSKCKIIAQEYSPILSSTKIEQIINGSVPLRASPEKRETRSRMQINLGVPPRKLN